jgi:hypothetical protein
MQNSWKLLNVFTVSQKNNDLHLTPNMSFLEVLEILKEP